jgi:hypothetical protein
MRVAPIVVALLCTAAVRPVLAQQPVTSAPTPAAATPTPTPTATEAGPRLQPEWRRQEPTLPGDAASSAAARSQTHTVRYTTLTLVLVVIILVLLIA